MSDIDIRHAVTVRLSRAEIDNALRAHLLNVLRSARLPLPADINAAALTFERDPEGELTGCAVAFEPARVDPRGTHARWTPTEDEILRQEYHRCSAERLEILLPGRSYRAIELRASKLRLSRRTTPPPVPATMAAVRPLDPLPPPARPKGLGRNVTASLMGDPPPGRSAADDLNRSQET